MKKERVNKNETVTKFLDELNHPMRTEIELLRVTILGASPRLTENIKWNGPNYCFANDDRITMRIHPPTQIQLIFHRGVKKLAQPKKKIINDKSGMLIWKANDRAVVSFMALTEIKSQNSELAKIVKDWIKATS